MCSLLASVFALAACNVGDETTAHQKSTFFGFYTYEPASFAPRSEAAFGLRTDQAGGMELASGDRTQFCWGLLSIEDY